MKINLYWYLISYSNSELVVFKRIVKTLKGTDIKVPLYVGIHVFTYCGLPRGLENEDVSAVLAYKARK